MKVQHKKTHDEHLSHKQASKQGRSHTSSKKESLFVLLKQDHESVMDIFDELEEEESTESMQGLLSQLQDELDEHMQLEEKFFYPALEKNDYSRKKVLEAYQEHQAVKTVLSQLHDVPLNDERLMARVKVLRGLVTHHIEEEENKVFKIAEKSIGKEKLQEIAVQVQKAKSELIWH